AAAQAWCIEVNTRVHTEIDAVPAQRLREEQAVLGPLPSLRLQIGPPPVTRKVDKLSCIRFGSARYSVPTRLIGATVTVTAGEGRLLIADPATGEVAGDHARTAPGTASILYQHYSTPTQPPSRGTRPKTNVENRYCAPGQVIEQLPF